MPKYSVRYVFTFIWPSVLTIVRDWPLAERLAPTPRSASRPPEDGAPRESARRPPLHRALGMPAIPGPRVHLPTRGPATSSPAGRGGEWGCGRAPTEWRERFLLSSAPLVKCGGASADARRQTTTKGTRKAEAQRTGSVSLATRADACQAALPRHSHTVARRFPEGEHGSTR